MKLDLHAENAKTLAAALEIDERVATELLNVNVLITFDERNNIETRFAKHIERMLSRTIRTVCLNGRDVCQDIAVEFVIGDASPVLSVTRLFAAIGKEQVVISPTRTVLAKPDIHPVGLLLGSCYAVGAILNKVLKDSLPYPSPEVFNINLAELVGDDLKLLYETVQVGEAYLAGAGAIGNGFIYALSQFRVQGTVNVADHDMVSDGNLQRCVLFSQSDVDLPKADCLCRAAEAIIPNIQWIPHRMRLQDVPAAKNGGAWLKRLIVGVDSRRVRRSLQAEIPGEVYDASTTEISEVVLHFNRQPTDLACMSCIYHESPDENAHERHVAEALGVSLDDVKQNQISENAAKLICRHHPHLYAPGLVGLAYDSLFKQLCSTKQLTVPGDRQVLTPFAFVSVLAGTLLAIEFVRRVHRHGESRFNLWHVSPWTNPVLKLQRNLVKRTDCEFCANPILAKITRQLWQTDNHISCS